MKRRGVPIDFEEGLAVTCLALLVAITLLNVVTRYLTAQSFAWTEEISIFLMVVMTLAGAGAAAARDRHIRIEFFYEGGSAKRRRTLRIVACCVTGMLFAALALLSARMVADELRWGETTMGLGVPRWWYTIAIPLLSAAVAARCLALAWRTARTEPGA
ncbi:MAG: TRAP transporter small permease [Rubrivivax sp.]|nr:TRAP transporter small permease [Rubrivivax sp.]